MYHSPHSSLNALRVLHTISDDRPWTCRVTHTCWPVCGSASPGIFPSPRPSLSGFEIFFPFFFFFLAAQVNNLLEISVVHYLCQLFHVLKPHSSADIGGKLSVCVCVCVVCVRTCSVAQSCSTFCNPVDCHPPGSSVHEILQARILEWFAISFTRRSSWPRDWTHISWVSCIDRQILYHCITWEAPMLSIYLSWSLPLAWHITSPETAFE